MLLDIRRSSRVAGVSVCAMIVFTMAAVRNEGDDASKRGEGIDPCSLEAGKALLQDPVGDAFVEIDAKDVPHAICSQVKNSIALRLQSQADPRKANKVRVRVFAAYGRSEDDVVEYQWRFHEQNLRVVVGRNAIRIDIDLDEVNANDSLAEYGRDTVSRARGLISGLMTLEGTNTYNERYSIALAWPVSLDDGATFSFNPEKNIRTLLRWHERIDIFVHDGTLSVLSYKRVPQLGGYQDGSRWFSDDFRELIHQKAREQGRMPEKKAESSE